jgi:6-phosphogluconate dehydrogenase
VPGVRAAPGAPAVTGRRLGGERLPKYQVGLIGLAVMGANLALNIERHGFSIAVFNRTWSRTEAFMQGPAKEAKNLAAFPTLREFVAALERPRRIIVMVQAGAAVDGMLEQLVPLLEPGDVVMDGGNSYFRDTERRERELAARGLQLLGTGISGGEEGALHGPCIMPGGARSAYELFAPILTKIAAQVSDGPCCAYMGPGGAGHYVKMVHNGIEYGDIQLICEAYDLLSQALGMSATELAEVFAEWNRGELDSYLIEITAKVLAYVDPETGKPLVDLILDKAGQKGTGKWTAQEALDLGVPIPTIDAALWMRNISAQKAERVVASGRIRGHRLDGVPRPERAQLVADVAQALYASKVASYAQGMAMLRAASEAYGWGLDLVETARIWKGGCIIRARLLDRIQAAYGRDRGLQNLLLDPYFAEVVDTHQLAWRRVVDTGVRLGIPMPAMAASLQYVDAYRSARLPANLLQGLRDYFGAHTYERVDREGVFHTHWEA